MQQANKKFLIKYGVFISILNAILITSVLVLYDLYFDYPESNTKKKGNVEEVKQKPPTTIKEKVVKKRPVSKKAKPRKVVLKEKKRRVVKKICIVNIHRPECRKPDITSMPAELKDYYNYDPIKKVWVWTGD